MTSGAKVNRRPVHLVANATIELPPVRIMRISAQWKAIRTLEIPGPLRKHRVAAMATQTLFRSNPMLLQRNLVTVSGIPDQLSQRVAHGARVTVLTDESEILMSMCQERSGLPGFIIWRDNMAASAVIGCLNAALEPQSSPNRAPDDNDEYRSGERESLQHCERPTRPAFRLQHFCRRGGPR